MSKEKKKQSEKNTLTIYFDAKKNYYFDDFLLSHAQKKVTKIILTSHYILRN